VDHADELARLENALAQAVQERDMAFLEAHIGPEFTLTTGRPGAEVRSRSEWLQLTRDEYVVESFEFDDLIVQDYGDAAVVRSRYRQTGSMGGADRTGAYLMTDVWVRRDDRWQLVARHITPLAPDRPNH
jgi:ketosteroid isomerase-like protein